MHDERDLADLERSGGMLRIECHAGMARCGQLHALAQRSRRIRMRLVLEPYHRPPVVVVAHDAEKGDDRTVRGLDRRGAVGDRSLDDRRARLPVQGRRRIHRPQRPLELGVVGAHCRRCLGRAWSPPAS